MYLLVISLQYNDLLRSHSKCHHSIFLLSLFLKNTMLIDFDLFLPPNFNIFYIEVMNSLDLCKIYISCGLYHLYFYQSEKILVQLDELDRITHALIGFN